MRPEEAEVGAVAGGLRRPKKRSRILGNNLRACGSNPRAQGTNPRAQGSNPRVLRFNPKAQGTNPRAAHKIMHTKPPSSRAAISELLIELYINQGSEFEITKALAGAQASCDPRRLPEVLARHEKRGNLRRVYCAGGRGRAVKVKIPRPWALWEAIPPELRKPELMQRYERAGWKNKGTLYPAERMRIPPHPLLKRDQKNIKWAPRRKKDGNIENARAGFLKPNDFAQIAGPESWWFKQIKPLSPDSVEFQTRSTALAQGARPLKSLAGALEWLATENDSDKVRRVGLGVLRHLCWNLGLDKKKSFEIVRLCGEGLAKIGRAAKRRFALNNFWAWLNRCDPDELAALPWPALRARLVQWCEDPPRNFEAAASDPPAKQVHVHDWTETERTPPPEASAATRKNPLNPTRPPKYPNRAPVTLTEPMPLAALLPGRPGQQSDHAFFAVHRPDGGLSDRRWLPRSRKETAALVENRRQLLLFQCQQLLKPEASG